MDQEINDRFDVLARGIAELSREVERFTNRCEQVAAQCEALVNVGMVFSEEDIVLIKSHVRHPGALDAAKLRERIRCACVVLEKPFETATLKQVLNGGD